MNTSGEIWLILSIGILLLLVVMILYWKLKDSLESLEKGFNDNVHAGQLIEGKIFDSLNLLNEGKKLPKNTFSDSEIKMAEYITKIRNKEA